MRRSLRIGSNEPKIDCKLYWILQYNARWLDFSANKQYIFIILINYVHEWFAVCLFHSKEKLEVLETMFLFELNLFVRFKMNQINHSHKCGNQLEQSILESSSVFVRCPYGCMNDSVTHWTVHVFVFLSPNEHDFLYLWKWSLLNWILVRLWQTTNEIKTKYHST